MITIYEYLKLRSILDYLNMVLEEKIKENNNFSNQPIEQLEEKIKDLEKILNKLEEEK